MIFSKTQHSIRILKISPKFHRFHNFHDKFDSKSSYDQNNKTICYLESKFMDWVVKIKSKPHFCKKKKEIENNGIPLLSMFDLYRRPFGNRLAKVYSVVPFYNLRLMRNVAQWTESVCRCVDGWSKPPPPFDAVMAHRQSIIAKIAAGCAFWTRDARYSKAICVIFGVFSRFQPHTIRS